jgi:hypothetical protein
MAWTDIFLRDDEEQNPQSQPLAQGGGWVQDVTGAGNERDARNAFGMALLQAAASMGAANQGRRGYEVPRLGNILAQGAAGFGGSLGVSAMQRRQAEVQAAKQRMAEAEAAQQQAERDAFARLPAMVKNGQVSQEALLLPGAAGERARQLYSMYASEQAQRRQAGLSAAAAARAAQARDDANWQVDVGRGIRVNRITGQVQPLMTVDAQTGASVPWAAQQQIKPQSIDQIKIAASEAAAIPEGQRTPEQKRLVDQGKALGMKIGSTRTDNSNAYAETTLQDIRRARDFATDYTLIPNTGIGSWLSWVPGTTARNLDATLNTIKANIGFDRLQQMRENSPTGGALGQISDRENKLLQSVFGSLEQAQDEATFLYNLNRLEETYMDIVHGKGNWRRNPDGEVFTGPQIGNSSPGRSSQSGGANVRRYNPSTMRFE